MCAKKKSCMHKLLKMYFPMKTNLSYMYQKNKSNDGLVCYTIRDKFTFILSKKSL